MPLELALGLVELPLRGGNLADEFYKDGLLGGDIRLQPLEVAPKSLAKESLDTGLGILHRNPFLSPRTPKGFPQLINGRLSES